MPTETHDQAINAIVGCSQTVTVLSYEEAIFYYLRARTGCPNEDGARFDDLIRRAPVLAVGAADIAKP